MKVYCPDNAVGSMLSDRSSIETTRQDMKRAYRFSVFILQFAILGLAAAFVIGVVSPPFAERVRNVFAPAGSPPAVRTEAHDEHPSVTQSAPDHAAAAFTPESEHPGDNMAVSYSSAVLRAAPAVVSITADKVISTRQVLVPTNPVLQRMFPGIAIGPPRK